MKKSIIALVFGLGLLIVFLGSCKVVFSIFKAGFWAGALMILLVILVIFWLSGKRRD